MKLLHIDSSILGENSVSRQLTAAVVSRLAAGRGDVEIVHRDLTAAPIDHLTLGNMAEGEAALQEFLAADIVVVGAPMYNFSVPSQLKAWIDRVVVAQRTFRYTATGVEGLAGGKRVVVALSRGGLYGAATPMASFEHVESYLRAVFGFIGCQVEFVLAEGVAMGPEARDAALAGAMGSLGALAA